MNSQIKNPAKIKTENQFPIIQFESEFLSIEFLTQFSFTVFLA